MAQFIIHAIVAGNGWMEIRALSIVVKEDETVRGFGMSDSAEESVSDSAVPCAVLPTCYVPPPAVKNPSGQESTGSICPLNSNCDSGLKT